MGNCVAPCGSKLVFTEARGGLNEQPLHSVGDNNKNGRDGQKCRSRSRSSESKEAGDLSSSKPAVSCKNTGGIVRVKLVIRKQELAELLSKGLVKRAAVEDLFIGLQAKLGDQSTALYNPYEENCGTAAEMSSHSVWRPSLESIPEDKSTNN